MRWMGAEGCDEKTDAEAVDVPLVNARRAIGFACRNVEAPLRRAERTAN
jgi:hypothetical protein